MITIPLSSTPSQLLTIVLSDKLCQMAIYTLGAENKLYIDVSIAGSAIVTCVLCHDRVKLIQLEYLGFPGDLSFVDTQGADDPVYSGLGSRFFLAYLP